MNDTQTAAGLLGPQSSSIWLKKLKPATPVKSDLDKKETK